MTILYFCLGLLLGLVFLVLVIKKERKSLSLLHDKNLRLEQEKEIAVEFMHNLAVAIGEGVAKKDLYQRVAHTAVLTTGAMSSCVYEKLPNGRLQGMAVEGLFPPQREIKKGIDGTKITRALFLEKVLSSEILERGEGIVGEVAKTGKSVFVADAKNDPRMIKHQDSSLQVKSMIYSPMAHNDKIIGVLVVANPTNELPFSETDLSLVNSLAEQAALAINNSDAMNLRLEKSRMDSDLRLAHDVQELFLQHRFPNSKEIEVDALYRPSSQVGGDFYDFYKLSSTKFAVSIADVSGKGVPASLLMALCQTNLRHLVTKNRAPAEVLKKLNKELEQRIREDMFITLFLAFIDTQKDIITFARAGHEPALLLNESADGELGIKKLHGDGMAIGMVPSEIFDQIIEDCETKFTPKDMLVLYTDGVTEAVNEDREEFGLDRLSHCLFASSNLSAKDFNNKLLSKLEEFRFVESDKDDITLLSVRRL